MIHFRTALGLAEGEAIVFHRQECFLGSHFVHLELYGFTLKERIRIDTREVKSLRPREKESGEKGSHD
jgi:hypothetical protein